MTDNNDPSNLVEFPGEWALKRLLGPTIDIIGQDLSKLYEKGRDRIVRAASRKTPDLDDGKGANLRVAREVFWSGAFSDDEVCAEYFGGLLAASRSKDGKDDRALPFVEIVKSLSSAQLTLHYELCHALSNILVEEREQDPRAAFTTQRRQVFVGTHPQLEKTGINLEMLLRRGLVSAYGTDRVIVNRRGFNHCFAVPTQLGTMLYAAAHNRLDDWQRYGYMSLGEFDEIEIPSLYAGSLDKLEERAEELVATSC